MNLYKLKRNALIIKYNIKLCFGWNYVLVLFLCVVFLIAFNVRYITEPELIIISRLYFGLLGAALFTTIGYKERSDHLDVFLITKTSFYKIVLLRFIYGVLYTAICILLIFGFIYFSGGQFDFVRCVTGVIISIVLIGLIGMTITQITNDDKSGYIVSVGYYLLEFWSSGAYSKKLYLYSVLENRESALWGSMVLFGLLFAFCISAFVYRNYKG